MFFLLKSAFWLGLVFYCMSWPGGQGPQGVARQAAGEMVERAQTAAAEAAMSACRSDPARCLALASATMRRAPHDAHTALRGTISE